MRKNEPKADEDAAAAASLQKGHNRWFFELSDLLRYTFKSPSSYDSRLVRLKGRRGYPFRFKERICPIAYRDSSNLFGMGGVVSVMGGNRPFVWMASDGALVIEQFKRYEIIDLMGLVARLNNDDYELLTLWLSNDAPGALTHIKRRLDAQIEELATL